MQDCYERFIQLSQQQCVKQDYENPSRVREHNLAFRRLQQLQAEMLQEDCTSVLKRLLSHGDPRVRIHAAAMCMRTGLLSEQARAVLEHIAACDADTTMAFSAQMLLEGNLST